MSFFVNTWTVRSTPSFLLESKWELGRLSDNSLNSYFSILCTRYGVWPATRYTRNFPSSFGNQVILWMKSEKPVDKCFIQMRIRPGIRRNQIRFQVKPPIQPLKDKFWHYGVIVFINGALSFTEFSKSQFTKLEFPNWVRVFFHVIYLIVLWSIKHALR